MREGKLEIQIKQKIASVSITTGNLFKLEFTFSTAKIREIASGISF